MAQDLPRRSLAGANSGDLERYRSPARPQVGKRRRPLGRALSQSLSLPRVPCPERSRPRSARWRDAGGDTSCASRGSSWRASSRRLAPPVHAGWWISRTARIDRSGRGGREARPKKSSPLGDPSDLGMLLENLVAASLRSFSLQSGCRLHHWRDKNHEVDLVLDHPTEPLAFEIASSPNHSRSGLRTLTQRHRRFEGRTCLAAPQATVIHPESSGSGIGSLPLDTLLLAVGSGTQGPHQPSRRKNMTTYSHTKTPVAVIPPARDAVWRDPCSTRMVRRRVDRFVATCDSLDRS